MRLEILTITWDDDYSLKSNVPRITLVLITNAFIQPLGKRMKTISMIGGVIAIILKTACLQLYNVRLQSHPV